MLIGRLLKISHSFLVSKWQVFLTNVLIKIFIILRLSDVQTLRLQYINTRSIGHIIGICCPQNPFAFIALTIVSISVFNDILMPRKQFPQLIQNLNALNPISFISKYLYLKFYKNKCKYNQISSVLFKYQIVHDDFDKGWQILLSQLIIFKILSYLALKIRVNWTILQDKFDKIIRKFL